MRELMDKVLLLASGLLIYYFFVQQESADLVTPFLFCLIFGSLSSFFEKIPLRILIFFGYLLFCFFYPVYLIFFPFMMYDLAFTNYQYLLFFVIVLVGVEYPEYPYEFLLCCVLLFLLAFYIKYKTKCLEEKEAELVRYKDTSMELLLMQEEKNRSLIDSQDYEINLAMLNERNRISKEIHDNVGHLLSRSLIQIGALLTVSKEELVRQELENMKLSISQGMDTVRSSIHNMHDDSVDLYTSIQKLVKEFQFCEIEFEYDIHEDPPLKIRYCMIATVTEALSNVIKHSNAKHVRVMAAELPAYYKLVISDDGTIDEKTKHILMRNKESGDYLEGMGLHSILERVNGFKGSLDITVEQGFRIYMTIPKQQK